MFCVNCGAAVLPENKFCVSCGKPLSGAAAQAMPQSVGGGLAAAPAPAGQPSLSFGGYAGVPGGYVGVGFWPRAGARIIDLIIHYVVYFIGAFIFGIMLGIVAAASHTPLEPMMAKLGELSVSGFVLAWLGEALYHTVMEGGAGTTIGKLAIGAVVLQDDGTPCRYKSAFIRSVAYFVDGLFFGVIGYMQMNKTPLQQRYGDTWGHTMVIPRTQAPPAVVSLGSKIFGMLVLACIADMTTVILSFALKLA